MSDLRASLDRSTPVRFWRRFTAAGPGVLSAAVAFNLFFAIVPATAALLAAASIFGRQDEIDRTQRVLEQIAPSAFARFVSNDLLPDVEKSVGNAHGPVIVALGVVALWLASRGVVTLQRVLARIEGMADDRPWWKIRLIGMALTAGGGGAFVASAVLLVAGDRIAEWLEALTDSSWVIGVWQALSLPFGSLGLFIFLVALYRYAPPRRLPGLWLASLLATIGTVAASLGFRFYVEGVGSQASTLAVFGAFAILLLWLYLIAYVIIISAAVAATASRRWDRRRRARRGEAVVPADETAEINLGLETLEQETVGEHR